MTVDERIDRLVERHEALAQSVELLRASTEELRISVASHDRYLSTIMDGLSRLLETATNHERRLTRLEDRPSQ
jgi:prefoldin subunit 5